MYASQQHLQILRNLYRLRELYILKDNIGLEFNNMHYNKPARKIDHVFNKALKEEIANVVDGTGNNIKPAKELKNTLSDALKQQQKTLIKNPDRYIKHAVKSNTKDYNKILQNRIKKETHSLSSKIEQERFKTAYEGLSNTKLKKELYSNLKGAGAIRPKRIIKDALHTNQSNIGFIKALDDGYLYKDWNNGRMIGITGGSRKSRTRPWHRRIKTVPIDDYFDIYGSYHAQLMYPGDLNGGAENVANCRCWSRYTNTKPTDLGRKGNGGIKRITNGSVQSFTDLWKQKLTPKSNSKSTKRNSKPFKLQANNDNNDKTKIYYTKNHDNKSSKQDKNNLFSKIKLITKYGLKDLSLVGLNEFYKAFPKVRWIYERFSPNIKRQDNIKEINFKGIKIIKTGPLDYLSFDVVKRRLNSLPKVLRENIVKIKLNNNFDPYNNDLAAVYHDARNVIEIYFGGRSSREYIDVIVHEATHILDNYYNGKFYGISNKKGKGSWEEAFNNDKKHMNKQGITIENNGFVSEYAEKEYKKALDKSNTEKLFESRFAEDLADAVPLYLKNKTAFAEIYPNRAKILEKILGV